MKKIICIAVLMSMSAWCFAAPTFTTLRETRNIVGPRRLPHKKLSPAQVALKNVIALAESDWAAYCETLPPEQAAEWRKNNVVVTSGVKLKRGQGARLNPRYEIVQSKKKSGAMIVVVEERFPNQTKRYTMTLEKTRSGWLVIAKEEELLSSILRK